MPARPAVCIARCAGSVRQRLTASSSRQNDSDRIFSGPRQRDETFDGNKAVDRFQVGTQRGGRVEVILAPAGRRLHFEDHGAFSADGEAALRAWLG
jgi:hypothetical protein